jgi:hypothetical protein
MYLVDLSAIRLKAKTESGASEDERTQNVDMCVPVTKAVTKISCVEYQNIFSGLYEVSRNLCVCRCVSLTAQGGASWVLSWSHPSVPDPEMRNG